MLKFCCDYTFSSNKSKYGVSINRYYEVEEYKKVLSVPVRPVIIIYYNFVTANKLTKLVVKRADIGLNQRLNS